MIKNTTFTDKSIDQIGLPKDYKDAISEYIRNGFEAGASNIDIIFSGNSVGHIEKFEIRDNGKGINFVKLDEYFGQLLDSHKQKNKTSSEIYGGKGKGRLSFQTFAGRAKWKTIYKDGKDFFEYTISIDSSHRNKYDNGLKDENSLPPKTSQKEAGTNVVFENIKDITLDDLDSYKLRNFLNYKFGWFLLLNKEKKYEISINGIAIDYESIVADSECITEKIEEYDFEISYVRWDNKIGENALYHFLEEYSLSGEKHRENTGYNKIGGGAYGFYHSIYIKSDYFKNFHILKNKDKDKNSFIETHDQYEKTYKKLKIFLNKFVKEKRDNFYRLGADKKIKEFEDNKTFPLFSNNRYDEERKKDFITVFKEIYLLEPVVFQNLKAIQVKSLLGMLNLLLDSNERENVLTIVDGFVSNMDADGRKKLAETLKKTSFNNIVRTIKLIENRFESIETLKQLIFDLKEFTNERDHIQKIIENNYWLFGEQFHLTSADKNFEIMLNNYMAFLEGNPTATEMKRFKVDKVGKNRRPDIFLCRQQDLPNAKSNDESIEENIIVELKRPTVHIGVEQYRQIEDYMNFIINEDQFNSELRQWKFYIVGNKIEKEVKQKYKSFEKEGKKFLVNKVENYEIYAVSWDDLFQSFKSRHKYLLDKLNFDKQAINEELKSKGVDFSQNGSDKLAKLII